MQVDRSNLKDVMAARIREAILAGELTPGTKIDQELLAQEAGLSRLPVREALIQLTDEGLVTSIPRRGSFVAELHPEDVHDHFFFYATAAGIAAGRAAATMTEGELEQLKQVVEQMDAETDPEKLELLNATFHRIINRAGARGRLMVTLKYFAKSLPTRFYAVAEGWAAEAQRHHWAIYEALSTGDSDLAQRLTREHLEAGADHAVEMLRRRGFWDTAEPAVKG